MPKWVRSYCGSFCIYIKFTAATPQKGTTMLSNITIICRVTRDPELKQSSSGVVFTCLDVVVNKGYGEKEHPNYYKAYFKEAAAQRVINAGVKKGSTLCITGDLDIRTYTKRDGTAGTSNDINASEWAYLSTKPKTDDTANPQNGNTAQSQPQTSPQQNFQPAMVEVADDDDLPF